MREGRIFAVAVAAIAAHAVDDAFVSAEPGTSAGNHAIEASVTLALLLLAALLYPRLRPGLRAALALVLGALAVEGFVLAVMSARATGAGGDDWTGFLLLPAGLALVWLGTTGLWRSRRPTGHRYVRRGLLVAAAAVGAYVLVVPVAVAIVATHRPREATAVLDLGRPSRAVTMRTADGLALHGRYVASRNGAAVLVYPASASRAPQARMLAEHGYGVLVLEMRGYGTSEGDPNAFGWTATRDIDAAVAFLGNRPDVRDGRIGGIGFSVGGEQLLEAAAANSGLRAVVSDGAGERSLRETLLYGPRGWLALPTAAVQTAAVAVLSGHGPPPALDDVIGEIAPRPILLVYAGHGGGGEELQPSYFAAAGKPKAIWKIPEATHTGGHAARPREYERRVTGFFERALLAPTAASCKSV